MRKFRSLVLAGLLCFLSYGAQASTLALDFTGGTSHCCAHGTVGWNFRAESIISVNALGVWDELPDGLQEDTEVGLWTDTGILLASVTVFAGTSSPLVDEFRFEPISPITLSAGVIYRIGSFGKTVPFINSNAVSSTAPEITYIDSNFSFESGLVFPSATNNTQLDANFGPNFMFTSYVPEPTTILLLGLGLAGLGFARRRPH